MNQKNYVANVIEIFLAVFNIKKYLSKKDCSF